MTAALTPARALAYLRELSLDVRAAAVLDADGACLAGDAALARRAAALLAGSGPDAASATDGLLLARTADGGAIAVLAGDFALLPLLAHDLQATAAALATAPVDQPITRESPP